MYPPLQALPITALYTVNKQILMRASFLHLLPVEKYSEYKSSLSPYLNAFRTFLQNKLAAKWSRKFLT